VTRNTYLEALTNAQSIEELWDMHCRQMASYGFDRIISDLPAIARRPLWVIQKIL